MTDDRTPIIVGVGQLRQTWKGPLDAREPLELMAEAATTAVADASATGALRASIDAVHVVNILSWSYRDAPSALASRLGIAAGQRLYTSIGGNSPQSLVNAAAQSLSKGQLRAVLLAGGEAGYSRRRARSDGLELDWTPACKPQALYGDVRMGANQLEMAYDLLLPADVYPLFESALRADRGHSPTEHREFLGRLCAAMSRQAASHACAWSQDPLDASTIASPGRDNRYIGYPYTKLMNANLDVDQAAALIMTTVGEARRLGIDRQRWVYPMGGADLCEVWHVSQRPRLERSPAIGLAAHSALDHAGVSLQEIGALDLYSCFPSAVQLACHALELASDDPRGVTITGGLPYFGGCGNNYTMHAIATMVERIRERPPLLGLVTALGWYSSKHAVGVYGTRAGLKPWNQLAASSLVQKSIDSSAMPPPLEQARGRLHIEALVVRHDRDNQPFSATAIGRLDRGRRAIAKIEASSDELLAIEKEEVVGLPAPCRFDNSQACNLIRMS